MSAQTENDDDDDGGEPCPNPRCKKPCIRLQDDTIGLPYFPGQTRVGYTHCCSCGIRGPMVSEAQEPDFIARSWLAYNLWEELFNIPKN